MKDELKNRKEDWVGIELGELCKFLQGAIECDRSSRMQKKTKIMSRQAYYWSE